MVDTRFRRNPIPEEWRRTFADPEAIAAGDQLIADWQEMAARWADLQKLYPHQYVAMYRRKVVAHDPDLDTVEDALRAK